MADQIPYAPMQPAPLQFQGGPYAQVASTKIAHTPTSLDWMKGVSDVGNNALQSYMAQQRLNQQGPGMAANARKTQLENYWNEPTSAGVGGSSPQAPQPSFPQGDQSGLKPPVSPAGNGIGRQSPLSIMGPQYASAGVPDTGLTMDHFAAGVPGAAHLGWDAFKSGQQQPPQQPQQPSQPDIQVPRSQQYPILQAQASGRIMANSPALKSVFGNASPQDLAMSGMDPGKIIPAAIEAQTASTYKGLNYNRQVDDYDRTEGSKIGQELNSLSASGRTALGQAANTSRRVQSAQQILARPDSTPQEISAAINDVSTILAGGQSYESLNKEQGYNTLATRWANLKTLFTSQPQAVQTPEIKQRVLSILGDLSKVSDNVITRNTQTVQAAHAPWIRKYPEQWRQLVASVQPDQGAVTPQTGGASGQGGYLATATSKDGRKMGTRDGKTWEAIQ